MACTHKQQTWMGTRLPCAACSVERGVLRLRIPVDNGPGGFGLRAWRAASRFGEWTWEDDPEPFAGTRKYVPPTRWQRAKHRVWLWRRRVSRRVKAWLPRAIREE
jgi:hypothetical protein